MVNEFKRKRDTAKMIFKRLKACSFNKGLLKQKFEMSSYEKESFNDIYGGAFRRL